MPEVTPDSRGSVVVVRARGVEEVGATLTDVIGRYSTALREVGSKLMIVTDSPRIRRQLSVTGVMDGLGEANFYLGTEWLGETVRRAYDDATHWVAAAGPDGSP